MTRYPSRQQLAALCAAAAREVAASFGVHPRDLLGRRKPPHLQFARHILIYVLRRLGLTLAEIAEATGRRDIHSPQRSARLIARRAAADPELAASLDRLISCIPH